jgi:hypothetical protein
MKTKQHNNKNNHQELIQFLSLHPHCSVSMLEAPGFDLQNLLTKTSISSEHMENQEEKHCRIIT